MHSRQRRKLWFVRMAALWVALGLVLTACGSGGGKTASFSDTITIGLGIEPVAFDPHTTRAGGDEYYISNVFERLLSRDTDGKLVPSLAEAYKVSADGLSVTFNLRKDVKFHNGDPMTSADVVFSYNRMVDPKMGNNLAFLLASVQTIDAPDDYTVVFHLSAPDAGFVLGRGYLTIVPKKYIEERGDEYFAKHPIGTGPVKFVERKIGESFTLERFDSYWGDKAKFKTFVFKILPDANSRVAAIRSGSVDLIAKVPPQNVKQLKADKSLTMVEGYSAENVWLKFGTITGSEPWANPLVRQAMDYAIDQQAIIDTTQNGLGTQYVGVTPLNSGYDRVPYKPRKYDPAKAKELLKKAGYADGFDFNIVAPVNGRLPASEQAAQAIAGYLNDVGIKTTTEIIENSQWLDAYQEKRGHPEQGIFALNGDQYTWDPAYRMQVQLECDAPYSALCDPKVDQYITQIATTLDPTEREDAYIDAYGYIYEQAYEVWIYSSKEAYALKKGLCWEPSVGTPFIEVKFIRTCG